MLKAFGNPATVTTSGNSPVVFIDGPATQNQGQPSPQYLSVMIVASAVSGTTPSLAVEVQWSNDGVNFASNQVAPDSLTAITAVGNTTKNFLTKGSYARLVYTVTGTTPSFTINPTAYVA